MGALWVEESRARAALLPPATANVSLCPRSAPPGQRLRREREDTTCAGREAGGHRVVAVAGEPAVQDGAHLRGQRHRARLDPHRGALLQVSQPLHVAPRRAGAPSAPQGRFLSLVGG